MKVTEGFKLLESRIEHIETRYQKLMRHPEPATGEAEDSEENEENNLEEKKHEKKEKQDDSEIEVDDSVPLIPELNCLSWPEWRKLRLSDYEWERMTDSQKRGKKKQRSRLKRFVIDVIADIGDLSHTEKSGSVKRPQQPPCRIRINSQHILDVLNEIANVVLPQPCQFLHPFKIIVDNLEKILVYAKTLEDCLTKARSAIASEGNHNDDSNHQVLSPSTEGGNGKPLVEEHPWAAIKNKAAKTKEEKSFERAQEKHIHYQCLIELIQTKLASEIAVAKAIKNGKAKKIMFHHLWHLFPPGETIYYRNTNRNEPAQASQVLKVSGGRSRLPNASTWTYYYKDDRWKFPHKVSPFTIDAFHLDFDGNKFRLVQDQYEIPRFTGECPILALPVFPLHFHNSTVIESLVRRGSNFHNLANVDAAHREYRGMTLDSEPEEIDGRVIVDFKQAPVFSAISRRASAEEGKGDGTSGRIFGLRSLNQTKEYELEEVIGEREDTDLTLYNDHTYDNDRTDKLFSTNKILLAQSQELSSWDLRDHQLVILPGVVYAYVLRSRRYCKLDIDLIQPIRLNRMAFDDLVLPKNHRKLIRSLVDRHSLGSRPVEQQIERGWRTISERANSRWAESGHGRQDTLSIVKGKGRGLIILLHGVPGVGKTSTAETIAEATGRPLLPVTCGDIGENAADVEKNLEQIFTNSHRWGCVLLLDEAEVFLTKRNLEDLKRNAMVSVFLRALEFYSGILFLTTNRVGTIDEAFKSRIHISLYYPPLDWTTSKLIWQVNLKRAKAKVSIQPDEILSFAKKQFHRSTENNRWNGRQIFNAMKTAIALAEFEKQTAGDKEPEDITLTADHLKQVANVAKKFDDYLLETQGGETTAAMNQQYRVRADKFGTEDSPQQKINRRPTKTRKLDLEDLPSTSEEDSDSSIDSSLSTEAGSDSAVEVKKSKKKSESSSKKTDDKKRSRKSKKDSKKPDDDLSEALS
ncbi:P-loop containing nucleoside triphosphate hydrolase protein [Xylariaceae sp. FL1651]|nr:P-loop containing nucleoside triphosphate hydrolase protein [Xylariaceae sp. FL1651]